MNISDDFLDQILEEEPHDIFQERRRLAWEVREYRMRYGPLDKTDNEPFTLEQLMDISKQLARLEFMDRMLEGGPCECGNLTPDCPQCDGDGVLPPLGVQLGLDPSKALANLERMRIGEKLD